MRKIWINDDVTIDDTSNLNNNAKHAVSLLKLLDNHNVAHEGQIVAGKEVLFDWGKIYVLAPNAVDHNAIAKRIAANLDNKLNTSYHINIKDHVKKGWTVEDLTPENDASIAILLHTNNGENGHSCKYPWLIFVV